jgi:hypothetical protein
MFLKNLNLSYSLPECVIQTAVAKMGVIQSKMLRDAYGSSRVDIRVYEQYTQLIEKWRLGIPPHLRLPSDILRIHDNLGSDKRQQSAMFRLELLRLNSLMLVMRPALFQCVATAPYRQAGEPHPNYRPYAQACVDAAIRTVRVCSIMMGKDLLRKRFWPFVQISFVSSLIIVWGRYLRTAESYTDAVQEQAHRGQEDSASSISTRVMEYFAEQDPGAAHFLPVLQDLESALFAHQSKPSWPIQPSMMDMKGDSPAMAPPEFYSSSSSRSLPRSSKSTSTPASTSTERSSSIANFDPFDPPNMNKDISMTDPLFGDLPAFKASDLSITEQLDQDPSFAELAEDLNMSDWLVNPQDPPN